MFPIIAMNSFVIVFFRFYVASLTLGYWQTVCLLFFIEVSLYEVSSEYSVNVWSVSRGGGS